MDEIIFEKESSSYSVTQLKISTPEGPKAIFADTFLAACDVPGIKKIVPKEWYQFKEFEGLKKLRAVAVATIQLRYDGWVTELNNDNKSQNPTGLDNLLYSADASFSCFADLALASPVDYRKEGMGSLLQCVLTPGDRWMGRSTETVSYTHLTLPTIYSV